MNSKVKGKNPVLAIAWGTVINFFQLQKLENLELYRISFIKLDGLRYGDVVGMAWLGERVLGVWDNNSNILILDPFSNTMPIESYNVADMEPVYHSRFDIYDVERKTIVTPLPSYHHSYASYNGNFFAMVRNTLSLQNRV